MDVLTCKEFAEKIGAGESTVRLWCAAEHGPLHDVAVKKGKTYLIPGEVLKTFTRPVRGCPPGEKRPRKPRQQ